MKVKKYLAPTMPEAMQQVRKDLGANAIILNSKQVQKGGMFGLFKKKKIEVVAALDPDPIQERTQKQPMPQETELQTTRDKVAQPDRVMSELQQMKEMIKTQGNHAQSSLPVDYQIVYQQLIEQEVMERKATDYVKALMHYHKQLNHQPTLTDIKHDLHRSINDELQTYSYQGITYQKQVVQFVGPTGVGKTTTIAKIAAKCMMQDHKRVALITQDTYRIAAIEQLKTYARILDVPVSVCYNQSDYQAAIHSFQAYDIILVDTAGRNFREDHYITELRASLKDDADTYLVLSLATKASDLMAVFREFEQLPLTALILTKLDETRQYGSIINLLMERPINLAYVTNGQDVPDDLMVPTASMLAGYITGDYNNA